jgi:hypothetical protein
MVPTKNDQARKNDQHPNWGGASRGQGSKTQARRWGKPKIGQNNLQNHYFARQVDMDEINTIETVNPGDEENMKEAETVKPGDAANMEEADMPPEHAWRRDHALLHNPDDESHQDEEAYTRNRDKFSGLLQDTMAKFTDPDYQQEANALVAKGHLFKPLKEFVPNYKMLGHISTHTTSSLGGPTF